MLIKGVAVDFEETMLDLEAAHHGGHIEAARELGLQITLEEAYTRLVHFIGGPDERVCEDIWNLLERSGLDSLFDRTRLVLREDVKNLKPAPDVFLRTAAIMGIDPRDQIVFENSPHGIMAARASGSKAVGMPTIAQAAVLGALIRAGAQRIFLSWQEVTLAALNEVMAL